MYSRFGAYGIAWRAFRGNLLSGIGYGRFQYYASHINAEHQVTFRGIWAANQAHNMLLSILAENGVMGVLPFFILAVAVVKSISRLRKQASSWLAREWTASMVGISIAYYIPWLFSTSGYYKALNCLFYLLLGITTKVASWEKDDEEVVLVGSANTFTQKAEDSL
jgi:O-antigen ligase